jgi:hypothetical protein
MTFTLANMIITAMAVTFILLGFQAEPFTATLGFVFAGILFLAVIRQTLQSARDEDARRPETTD